MGAQKYRTRYTTKASVDINSFISIYDYQHFEGACQENKGKLDAAAESRSHMEKQTKADNEVETLNSRWGSVKKVIDERVTKVSGWRWWW